MARPRLTPDEDTPKRMTIVAPASWAHRVDEWRRHQADLPNTSEAIRRLVDEALAAKKGKPQSSWIVA